MVTVKVKAVDMSDRLNAEGKYIMKVSGRVGSPTNIRCTHHAERYLDLSDFDIDQIGVIAGFLDAVFDNSGLVSLSGASVIKPEEIKEQEEQNNCDNDGVHYDKNVIQDVLKKWNDICSHHSCALYSADCPLFPACTRIGCWTDDEMKKISRAIDEWRVTKE